MCRAGQGGRSPTIPAGPPFGDSKTQLSGPSGLIKDTPASLRRRTLHGRSPIAGRGLPARAGPLRGCGSRLSPAYERRYLDRPAAHEAGGPRHGGGAARPAPGADSGGSHIRRRRGSRIPEVRAAADCPRWRRPRQVSAAGEGPGRRRAAADGAGGVAGELRGPSACRSAWPGPAIGRSGRVTPRGPAPLQRGGRDGGWEAVLAGRLSSAPSHLSANATQPFTLYNNNLWSVCH